MLGSIAVSVRKIRFHRAKAMALLTTASHNTVAQLTKLILQGNNKGQRCELIKSYLMDGVGIILPGYCFRSNRGRQWGVKGFGYLIDCCLHFTLIDSSLSFWYILLCWGSETEQQAEIWTLVSGVVVRRLIEQHAEAKGASERTIGSVKLRPLQSDTLMIGERPGTLREVSDIMFSLYDNRLVPIHCW